MKTNFLLLLIILTSFSFSSAQKKKFGKQFLIGTEFGFTGSLGKASLLNTNINADKNIESNVLFTDKKYGGRFSISRIGKKPFSSMISLYGEYLFNDFTKKYNLTLNTDNVGNYNKKLEFKVLDYIFAARYIYFFENRKSFYGNPIYFDLGIGISNFETITETNSVTEALLLSQDVAYDLKGNYASSIKSLIIGFGIYRKMVNFGLRFSYSLDNLATDNYFAINDGLYNDSFSNPNYLNSYSDYNPIKKLSVELKLEFNLALLSYGRCDYSKVGFAPFAFRLDPAYYWKTKR